MWVFLSSRLRRWAVQAVLVPVALAAWHAIARRRAASAGTAAGTNKRKAGNRRG